MGDMRFVWRIGGLVFVFLSAVCLFIPSLTLGVSVPPKENTWIDVAPMQQARSNLGAVAVEGKIYALGGIVSHYQGYGNNTFTVLDTNEVYDPVTNHWEYRTPMPLPSNDFAVAVCENKIYCINGGLTSSLNETTGIWTDVPGEGFTWVYDPAIDTWENKTAMPISRGNLQANVVDEKIYVMGSEYVYSSDIRGYVGYFILQVYDPVEDCWGLGSSMPEGFYGYSTVYLDKIYVVGTHAEPYWNNVGNLAYKATPMIQSYDPKKDVWTIAITEGPRIHAGAFSVSTLGVYAPAKLYCFYNALGAPNAQIFNCQVFDFETQSWDNYDVGPVVCEHFAVAVLDDMVYVVGGNTVSFDAPHGAPQFPIVTNLALTKRYVPFGYGRVAPVVSVLSLESMGEYGSRGVPLVFNLNRPVVWMGYSLDGQATVRVGGNVSLSGLSGGVHNVTVFAEDEYGNVGDSETITFVVVSETLFPISTVAMVVVGVVVIVCTVLFLIFRLRKNKHQKEPNHIVSIVNNDGFA